MQKDPLTGKDTCLQGDRLPSAREWGALLGDHRERLRALDQLVEAAAECDIHADKDRDFVRLPEDEVSLLEMSGGNWAKFGSALRTFRRFLPLIELDLFGFDSSGEDLFDENNSLLFRIGGGVEALAFESADKSIYKFYFFRESGEIGATFHFSNCEDALIRATAVPGSYRLLLEKLLLIHKIGMPTEVVGITPEGILVVKQALGEALAQGLNTSGLLPDHFIPIPSRFLRADRDHPRLYFHDAEPWLLADLHARNFVRCRDGTLRVIDLVAAPWPEQTSAEYPLIRDWIARVQHDPAAGLLATVDDAEL
jgi:hypothetical protein